MRVAGRPFSTEEPVCTKSLELRRNMTGWRKGERMSVAEAQGQRGGRKEIRKGPGHVRCCGSH